MVVAVELVLVRHGATDASDAGRFNGWADIPLNERGRAQASALRDVLSGIYDGIWSSDLARTIETAAIASMTATTDPRLRELDFGDLEGTTWEECSSEVRRSLLDFDSFVAPGGETTQELRARVDDFISSLGAGRHLLFTHGGVIRALLRAQGMDRRVGPGEVLEIAWEGALEA